ncbi:hypothetical protein DL93DRAFT_2171513 [Clavulina sp. PMI_390]|nr:hypothetical protein DL93DRAFT_2171513 [Clavulina sp. PMI_390]
MSHNGPVEGVVDNTDAQGASMAPELQHGITPPSAATVKPSSVSPTFPLPKISITPQVHSISESPAAIASGRMLFLSKIAHTKTSFTNLPNGFIRGSMPDTAFCQWVLTSPAAVRNATIVDATWWRSKRAPFHHQFIALTVAYYPHESTRLFTYELILERIGKGRSFGQRAEHRVSIHQLSSLVHLAEANDLIFGLFDAESAPKSDLLGVTKLLPYISITRASRDSLDEKWRGPPATLAHIARYVQHIVLFAPRYNLSSTNCYYFSRLLMHVIALRHYSFRIMATRNASDFEPLSLSHDPSSISSVFTFLQSQAQEDGVLMFHIGYTIMVMIIAVTCISCYIVSIVVMHSHNVSKNAIISFGLLAPWVLMYVYAILARIAKNLVVGPPQHSLPVQMDHLIQILDDDITLTHPRGKRGSYVPSKAYRVKKTITKPHPTRPISRKVKEVIWVDSKRPRAPVESWPNIEQCYDNLPRVYDGNPVGLSTVNNNWPEISPPLDSN